MVVWGRGGVVVRSVGHRQLVTSCERAVTSGCRSCAAELAVQLDIERVNEAAAARAHHRFVFGEDVAEQLSNCFARCLVVTLELRFGEFAAAPRAKFTLVDRGLHHRIMNSHLRGE